MQSWLAGSRTQTLLHGDATGLSLMRRSAPASHVPAVLPAHLEERARDLAQRADPHRVHQHLEDVRVADHGLLQPLEHRGRLRRMARLEITQPRELALLLLLRG